MYFLARQYCHATLDLLLSLARLSSTLVFTSTSTTAYTIPFCILYFLRYRANCTLTKIYALISLFPLRWKIWHPGGAFVTGTLFATVIVIADTR